jgi:hypothetical protein
MRTFLRGKPALAALAGAIGIALGVIVTGSHGQSDKLPPGHPPLGGSGPAPGTPMPPPPVKGAQELVWKVPAGWTQENPASSMRRAQYRIPGSAGAGECVVFYFGPGQGGDAESNAARWAGQFRGPDGKSPAPLKKSAIKIGDAPALLVEVTGTYVGGMGSTANGADRPDAMLLGAIVQGPDANWFFRAMGPRATMESQRAAFDGMIRSIRRGKSL